MPQYFIYFQDSVFLIAQAGVPLPEDFLRITGA